MSDSGRPANPGSSPLPDLTEQLDAAARGDRRAFDQVFALLYRELSALAHAHRRRWSGNETLNTTVLVHEAYLKLLGSAPDEASDAPPADRWENRRHFFAIASQVMRHILVTYAEAQRAAKRGGGVVPLPLDALEEGAVAGAAAQDPEEVLALHEALTRLGAAEPRQARIVECRFFAGMSIPETAEALGLSPATVKREWAQASAWLHRELGKEGS